MELIAGPGPVEKQNGIIKGYSKTEFHPIKTS